MQYSIEIMFNLAVSIGIIACFIFGIFGNSMIIAVIMKKKELRQKAGILLAITSASHNISLTCELANAYYSIVLIFGGDVTRKSCYILMLPYMFTFLHQAGMYFVSILDLLFAIIFPFWYARVDTRPYIFCMTIFPNIIGLSMLITTAITFVDDNIQRCNPYAVLVDPVGSIIFQALCLLNVLTLIVFIVTLIIFRLRKSKSNLNQASQVLRRIGVTAIVFTFSWFFAIYGANMTLHLPVPMKDRLTYQSVCVLPAVVAYASNFIACWFRSDSYRHAFIDVLGLRRTQKYCERRITVNISHKTSY